MTHLLHLEVADAVLSRKMRSLIIGIDYLDTMSQSTQRDKKQINKETSI